MNKKITYIIILILSIFVCGNVHADSQCKYQIDFSKFCTNGGNVSFGISFDANGKASLSSFGNLNNTDTVCNTIVNTQDRTNKKHAESFYSNNKKCPNVYFERNDYIYLYVLDDGMIVPTDAQTADAVLVGSDGMEEVKDEIVCSNITSKMRNESYDVNFKFYTSGGTRKWSVTSSNSSTPSTANADGIVTVGTHSFTIDSALADSIYNNKKCPSTYYLKCVGGGVESIVLTGTEPDDVENCAASVQDLDYERRKKEGELSPVEMEDPYNGAHVGDNVCGEEEVVKALKALGIFILIAKFAIAIIIIIMGVMDLAKTVMAGTSDSLKKEITALGWRVLIGLFIMFVPTLLSAFLSGLSYYNAISEEVNACQKCLFDPLGDGECKSVENANNSVDASDLPTDRNSSADGDNITPNTPSVDAGKTDANTPSVSAGDTKAKNNNVSANQGNNNKNVDANSGNNNKNANANPGNNDKNVSTSNGNNSNVVIINDPEYTKQAIVN